MQLPKEILVEIDADGNCSINGKGFVGTECEKFIQEIEQTLGKTISQTNKPEYRQRNINRARNVQRR